MDNLVNISIIGSGYVGILVGNGLKQLGNKTIFYDIDKEKVNQLKQDGHEATTDINFAIQNSEISFITVPTPTFEEKMDLSYIQSASESIANALRNKDGYHIIVVKSTLLPTTTENMVKPLLEEVSGKTCGKDFGLCMSPEFSTQIHASWSDDSMKRDFFSEGRIVIGEYDKKSGEIIEEIFKPLNVPIFRTDLKTAELIKYAHNCALTSKISYWNEICFICEKLGIDSNFVADVVAIDSRIGKYGTVHGKAFGGACLPKDLQSFIHFLQEFGHEPVLLKAIYDINERMKKEKGVRE